MDARTRGWAARAIRRAMRLGGARQMAVYRPERDGNGVRTGEAVRVGCVYGLRMDEAENVRMHIALPGVVAGGFDIGYVCAVCGCARRVSVGDEIEDGARRYEVMDVREQAGVVMRIFVREAGGDADGED